MDDMYHTYILITSPHHLHVHVLFLHRPYNSLKKDDVLKNNQLVSSWCVYCYLKDNDSDLLWIGILCC